MWSEIGVSDIEEVVEHCEKQRFEIIGDGFEPDMDIAMIKSAINGCASSCALPWYECAGCPCDFKTGVTSYAASICPFVRRTSFCNSRW